MNAGICDTCKVPKMMSSGNGIDGPTDPVLWCDMIESIIEPAPKDEVIKECKYYDKPE